ncbi:hypothetical protein [Roseateles sp. P5_E7]
MQNSNAFPPTGLPADTASVVLLGRVWRQDVAGPALAAVRGGELVDLEVTRNAPGLTLGPVQALLKHLRLQRLQI